MFMNFFIVISAIILLNIWLINGILIINDAHGNLVDSCHHTMNLKQIVQLLKQQPCVQLMGQEREKRQIKKRNTDAGNVDIHALQTTINDHRTMINYLINNSINATVVNDAILNHHSKTGPILNSWRDWIDLCTVLLFIGFIIYYYICRIGFVPCDKILLCCCKPILNRVQNQQQQQQQQNEQRSTTVNGKFFRKTQRQPHLSMASIEDQIGRIHNGYMSE